MGVNRSTCCKTATHLKKELYMKEITSQEIAYVSGAGLISNTLAFAGDVVIDAVKISNDALNTTLISSVGKTFDAVGLGSVHNLADSLGYAAFKTIAGVGSVLGGDASRIDYHYEWEWGA
jgi:N-acetylglutamate synthase/N-acetylornithine aminotransferase